MKPLNEMDMTELWDWTLNHPKLNTPDNFHSGIHTSLSIDLVHVDKITGGIRHEKSDSTKVQVWLEMGPVMFNELDYQLIPTHDIDLDCGGDTFEDAFRNLCELIEKHYGNYEYPEI